MTRVLLIIPCAILALIWATPADARWRTGGSGSGTGIAALMPGGVTPTITVSSQSVTVAWTQSTFLGSRLGSYSGGGYTVRRYAPGSPTALAPGTSCNTLVAGATATLQCVEANVPYGSWRYTVTPVMHTFTGAESPLSTTTTVTTTAPLLSSVIAQNPTGGQTTGGIQITWATTAGATGYNLYRRTTSGYDYGSPLNGATPLTSSSYSDSGAGLGATTAYSYVVRAVAASPPVESPSSNEIAATSITRPAAPSGSVSATAAAAAQIAVSWSSVAGVLGYNVYRRTSAGVYDFGSPLSGSTPLAGTTYTDTTSTDGTTYLYTVRSVITGAAGAQVESANSAETNSATADGTAPAVPTAVSVTGGGPLWSPTSCSVAAGTRYVNAAGQSAVGVTATIPTPESGESVVFSATTPGSTPVTTTVAAGGSTTVSTSLNLASLLDGTMTLTARTRDAAGNLSNTITTANAVIKDVVAATLTGVAYADRALSPDQITGASECGATITAVETAPTSHTYTSLLAASGPFTLGVATLLLSSYSYNVTATDRAGNTSTTTTVTGSDLL